MKSSYYILISIIMLLASCEESPKKEVQNIIFHWSVADQISNDTSVATSFGVAGPVTGISNGMLVIGGGSNFPNGAPWDGGIKAYYKTVYVFSIQEDALSPIHKTFSLPYHMAYSANCITGSGIIAVGGENDSGALNKVILVNWDSASQDLIVRELPPLPLPLTAGAVAAYKQDIYFAGGQNADIVSDKLFHLDLENIEKGWDTLATLPKPVTHAVLYAISNELYLVGGRRKNLDSTSDLYKEVYQFNIEMNQWTQKTSLPYALSAHTGVVWNDSTLLTFSGDHGTAFHEVELLLVEIAKEKNPRKKSELIAKKNEMLKTHSGFSGDILAYNVYSNKWEKIDSIPFPGQVTTTAIKCDKRVFIPCGEIRAGVRTPDILVGRIK